jgi:hypothetical protein
MYPTRRVFFNPTSVPSLRTKRVQTRDFYNAGAFKRVGLRKDVTSGRWKGVRRESTETGEDQTGHIAAKPNEAILFFDSM